MNHSNKPAGVGLLSAFAASLCCITPVLALFSGVTGIASAFSWVEPLRPWLMGVTVAALAFAWYQKLKPVRHDEVDCACETGRKAPFSQSKKFLLIVTLFAAVMLAFPYYSGLFYGEKKQEAVFVNPADIEIVRLDIKGMTCEACNTHIEHAVHSLPGVLSAKADYKTGTAEIKFDTTKVSSNKIIEAVNETGYKVKGVKK